MSGKPEFEAGNSCSGREPAVSGYPGCNFVEEEEVRAKWRAGEERTGGGRKSTQ